MQPGLFLLLTFLILSVNVFSQFKEKYFKDGYIIRQEKDTFACKIFLKDIESLHEKIVYKYKDSDEPITYHPGSIVTGFGFDDSGKYAHYTTVPHPLNKKGTKAELIFGEVVTNGFLKLYKYSFKREHLNFAGAASGSGPLLIVPYKTKSKRPVIDYFLYRTDIDSSCHLSTYMKDNMVKLKKELVDEFFGDHPELLKKIELDINLATFTQYLEEYNAWFNRKNKK